MAFYIDFGIPIDEVLNNFELAFGTCNMKRSIFGTVSFVDICKVWQKFSVDDQITNLGLNMGYLEYQEINVTMLEIGLMKSLLLTRRFP